MNMFRWACFVLLQCFHVMFKTLNRITYSANEIIVCQLVRFVQLYMVNGLHSNGYLVMGRWRWILSVKTNYRMFLFVNVFFLFCYCFALFFNCNRAPRKGEGRQLLQCAILVYKHIFETFPFCPWPLPNTYETEQYIEHVLCCTLCYVRLNLSPIQCIY